MKVKGGRSNNLAGKTSLPDGTPIKGKTVLAEKSPPEKIVFSFKDFDHTQGQTFAQWGDIKLLRILLDKIREYSRKTILEAQQASFNIYGEFPSHSHFTHPRHIIPDAIWASMHIQGKECIAGHIIDNTFYVVFFDKEHHFWPTEKKHT
jgi:hypothetical protein